MKERFQESRNAATASTEFPEAILLKEKATFFLAVVQSISTTFAPYLQNDDKTLGAKFNGEMALYKQRCHELLQDKKNAPKITQVKNSQKRDRYESDAVENEALNRIIKDFYNPIEVFFERCNAITQEEILNNLDAILHKDADVAEFLQNIKQKLQARKKIGILDYTYDPKIAELLDVYIITEAIHRDDSPFLLGARPVKPVKNRRDSVVRLPRFDLHKSSKKPQKQGGLEQQDIQQISAALSEKDIYDLMKIDPGLFLGKKCHHEAVRQQFPEIFNMEQKFLNFLESISAELLYIKDHINITGSQRKLIENFLKELQSSFILQKELCANMDRCRQDFALNAVETTNQNAISLFLGIYVEDNLKKQAHSFLQLTDYWPKIDDLLQAHKKECEQPEHRENLAVVAASQYTIKARVTQICSRREMISKEIIKSLQFGDPQQQRKVHERYQTICYAPIRDNLLRALREDGYVRPKTLLPLLEVHFNKDQRYSVAYFLIHPKAEADLKPFKDAFLSFATSFEGNESKLQFFNAIYALFQKKPMCLEDLTFLQPYLAAHNPLKLDNAILDSIRQALASSEKNSAVKIKDIVTQLVPAVEAVSVHLHQVLKQFQQSPDVVDVLLSIPEIKEKVGNTNSLAALDEKAIAELPSFWREIFVAEEGALRKFLTQKKDSFIKNEDVPEVIAGALIPLLDSEMPIDQFIPMRAFMAQKLLEREIDRQIDLLDDAGIFHEDGLEILRENIYTILKFLLAQIEDQRFFLFQYAESLLNLPYILMEVLANNFTVDMENNQTIFAYNFILDPNQTALNLKSLQALMLSTSQKNKIILPETAKTTSVFGVFKLVQEKYDPHVYKKLKEEIEVLNRKPADPSQKDQKSIVAQTPARPGNKRLSQDGKPPRDHQGLATPLRTPAPKGIVPENKKPPLNITTPFRTPMPIVKKATHLDFKKLIAELEGVAQSNQWQLKKCIQTSDGALRECRSDADKANCNFLEARDAQQLLFTAQSSTKDSSLTTHCHDNYLVAMTVAAMAKSMSPTATLQIDINAPDTEVPALIEKYVSQTVEQKLIPKVSVNGTNLTPEALYPRLSASLARDYQKMMALKNKGTLSDNRSVFLTPADSCRKQGRENGDKKKTCQPPPEKRTSRRTLF